MKIISNKEYSDLIADNNYWYEKWFSLQRETRRLNQKDWDEYQEWLNSPCCELVCPECEEDIYDTLEKHYNDIEVLYDRTDDLEGMMGAMLKDLKRIDGNSVIVTMNLVRRVTELEDGLERISKELTKTPTVSGTSKKKSK